MLRFWDALRSSWKAVIITSLLGHHDADRLINAASRCQCGLQVIDEFGAFSQA